MRHQPLALILTTISTMWLGWLTAGVWLTVADGITGSRAAARTRATSAPSSGSSRWRRSTRRCSAAPSSHASSGRRRDLDLPATAPLLNRIVCVVKDREARRAAVEFFARALLALYDRWGHANVTALAPEEREPERVSRDHFVVGEPGECSERLQAYAEMGIGHVACLMNFGGPDPALAERSMGLFGERVLPRFAAL